MVIKLKVLNQLNYNILIQDTLKSEAGRSSSNRKVRAFC